MNEVDQIGRLLASLANEEYCYLTTTGRVTGRPHEIEIWFGARGKSIYLLSGSHSSDWLKNLRREPAISVRIAEHVFSGTARLVGEKEEEMAARYMLAEKYQEWEDGKKLSEWARTAVVVGIDLQKAESV
jgi:deazaflavin-dependent oxidoreductase (nitroreductase family)